MDTSKIKKRSDIERLEKMEDLWDSVLNKSTEDSSLEGLKDIPSLEPDEDEKDEDEEPESKPSK